MKPNFACVLPEYFYRDRDGPGVNVWQNAEDEEKGIDEDEKEETTILSELA